MIETILTHISIWCPALAAVLGIALIVGFGLVKIRELRKTEDIKRLTESLNKQNKELEDNYRVQALLLDEITKIKDYAENSDKYRN